MNDLEDFDPVTIFFLNELVARGHKFKLRRDRDTLEKKESKVFLLTTYVSLDEMKQYAY